MKYSLSKASGKLRMLGLSLMISASNGHKDLPVSSRQYVRLRKIYPAADLRTAGLIITDLWIYHRIVSYLSAHGIPTANFPAVGLSVGIVAPHSSLTDTSGVDMAIK